jgi:tRNA(Ile2) C34 agmatinyltransferase TiaS
MSCDGSRPLQRQGAIRSLTRTVGRVLRSLRQGLAAWRITHRRVARPDVVVIGTLRRPRLAIAMRAAVVRTETTPPPMPVFLGRMVAHPLNPYCPRCSLPLEPWQADSRAEGTAMGYACRPCGTHIRWTPDDLLKQMQREVRRHYAHYWAQYREALRPYERGAPRGPPR